MNDRRYYSVRNGKIKDDVQINLELLRNMFLSIYNTYSERGYFQEYLGVNCTDGYEPGKCGDIELYSFRKLRQKNLFPVWSYWEQYSENQIFDLMEFLYDHISEPITASGVYHSWNNCGYHFKEFTEGKAKVEIREEFNDILKDYNEGYELSKQGEIVHLPNQVLQPLVNAKLPMIDADNVNSRVEAATRKYLSRHATSDDRRDAVRDLADVLEYLRPQVEKVLVKNDEKDLFQIANRFGIRHHKIDQHTQYDKSIWLSWMYYYYLATIHAVVNLIKKNKKPSDA
jgi:hypothetical protein